MSIGLVLRLNQWASSLNHDVFVQKCGKAIGFTDEMYQARGAQILEDAPSVFDNSDLIVKVKEPLPEENKFLSSKHILLPICTLLEIKIMQEILYIPE